MAYLPDQYFLSAVTDQPKQHMTHNMSMYAHQPQPHHQHIDFYDGHQRAEFAEFGQHAQLRDEYDDGAEMLTRPRLTKEQVEVLEAQFQAHPKPNSNVKRQLALQTKLTLPRVANWFQNRRAKAKQQRKQEEFAESTQSLDTEDGWGSETSLQSVYTVPLHINTSSSSLQPEHSSLSSGTPQQSASSTSTDHHSGRDSAQEASWASLQRALSAANAARCQFMDEHKQNYVSVSPAENVLHPLETTTAGNEMHQNSTFSDWTGSTASSTHWAPSQHLKERPFDFGFDQHEQNDHSEGEVSSHRSPEEIPAQAYAISTDMCSNSFQTPILMHHPSHEGLDLQRAHALQLPVYPNSRRGSSSSELVTNFGNFALNGTPPRQSPSDATSQAELYQRPEGELDIAARRKRPRPAELGSAALRSRSYGASVTMSPTPRLGTNSHSVRQVKSTGQNLNIRYAGIRKTSSAQRSPLTIATFAEADELNRLMGNQPGIGQAAITNHVISPPVQHQRHPQVPILGAQFFNEHDQETPGQYSFNGQPLNFHMTSPPSTPHRPDFFLPGQVQSMAAPFSAPAQYVAFPDYTPPYSAGPLTGSSWSDAPLTSPELPPYANAFRTTIQMTQPTCPRTHDFGNLPFQHLAFPQEPKVEMVLHENPEQKPTEFFIQEFPRQKEEHAHAAQQLAAQKPKSYIFANATPSDF